jgi:hypothetical protein
MSDTESTDTEQSTIDTHRELNRYDDRHEEWPSDAVFEPPCRTLNERWRKFHAARDCGSSNVYYREETTSRSAFDEKGTYRLVCRLCGHRVPEDEILFIGGEWYSQYGWQSYGRPIEDLQLPADRVLDLGADPSHDELVDALELTAIERQVGPHAGGPLRPERWDTCGECDHAVPLRYGDRCRMCYDGEWTTALTDSLVAFERKLRVHNNSFVHRLETEIDPFAIGDRAHKRTVLWRKPSDHHAPKVAVVERCLQDTDTDQWAYVLRDPADDSERLIDHDDLGAWYYDTGLHFDSDHAGISDKRLQEVAQRYA